MLQDLAPATRARDLSRMGRWAGVGTAGLDFVSVMRGYLEFALNLTYSLVPMLRGDNSITNWVVRPSSSASSSQRRWKF